MSHTPYSLVCGLEVHAELKTASKMFCSCANDPFHAPAPNTYTCPVCLGMPGGLPVANKKAIEWVIKLGLALNCRINLFSKFDRKNYFYPDLPKGYQISQYDIPFCEDGYLDTSEGRVRIRRIHLEEDTGKLIHTTLNGEKRTLIDFNRGGVPLAEVVTEPDIKTPTQAKEYGKKLRELMRYLEIADCDMEQGGMRLEANISMTSDGTLPNYKVEVKNINSFRFMEQAIAYEMERQAELLANGQTPKQETRGFDSVKNVTFSQRTKEDAGDYRYFPDPDLAPVRFSTEQIAAFKAELPELPAAVIERWQTQYQLENRFAESLVTSAALSSWSEEVFSQAQLAKVDINKLAAALINKKLAVELMVTAPVEVVKLYQSTTSIDQIDHSELSSVIVAVMAEFPNELAAYRAGKTQLANFFLGQIMKKLAKKLDMAIVRQALEEQLK